MTSRRRLRPVCIPVSSLSENKPKALENGYVLGMAKYWLISMSIPGECFLNKIPQNDVLETKKKRQAAQPKKIDAENIASRVFKLGEEPETDSF